MGQAGWQLRSDEDSFNHHFNLHAYHATHRIAILFRGLTSYRVLADNNYDFQRTPEAPLQGIRIALDYIQPMMFDIEAYTRVSHIPSTIEMPQPRRFAPLEPKTIIVEPKDVQECLDLISKLQSPVLSKIRSEDRKLLQFASFNTLG
jgi:hypothetical protein